MNIGILGLNKPSGMTSFDVVRSVKKLTGIKKIGHGGTLDPMADGVLPILINEGTAFFDALLYSDKIYEASIQLGSSTDTDDKEGKILHTLPVPTLSKQDILHHIQSLTGSISQIPPQFSALKVEGKRAYDLARQGVDVVLKPRLVSVYSWDKVSYDPKNFIISARIHCGSGTYIRSLARDLAVSLGTVGHLSSLRRVLSGGIALEDTLNLDPFPQNWQEFLIPPEEALSFLPEILWFGTWQHLLNGKPIIRDFCQYYPKQDGLYRLMFHDKIAALVLFQENKLSYRKNLAHLYPEFLHERS